MNKVCLIGRLTAKPELRTTSGNLSTTRFTLAVNRNFTNAQGEREADFITIVAWRKQAENICQYLDKGSLVSVEGRIQTGSFDDKDGNSRYTTEVIADQVNFLESRAQRSQSSSNTGTSNGVNPYDYQTSAPSNNYGASNGPSPYDYQTSSPSNNVNVDNDPFADFGDSVSIDDNFLD